MLDIDKRSETARAIALAFNEEVLTSDAKGEEHRCASRLGNVAFVAPSTLILGRASSGALGDLRAQSQRCFAMASRLQVYTGFANASFRLRDHVFQLPICICWTESRERRLSIQGADLPAAFFAKCLGIIFAKHAI